VKRKSISSFFAILVLIAATGLPTAMARNRPSKAFISVPGAVGFGIKPAEGENGVRRFLATYQSQGRLAKFAFELGPTHATEGLKAGQGRFVAEPGSDASAFLSELQKALGAKAVPRNVQRVTTLPFMFVDIGDNLSQASRGGFNVDPPGHWSAIKLFIGKGKQEGQVFLNINEITGKGQFSIKDRDYGDIVLKYLAEVL
jgi:hypothetical protein